MDNKVFVTIDAQCNHENPIFFANDKAHLTNNESLLQNVIKMGEMLQACDEKISGKVEAMVLKTNM